jgi:uncharacterized protein involved in exopolysaccharide biosynthesis/Mrp family chromosome partitioning ATPase
MNIVAASKGAPPERSAATIHPSQILALVRGHAGLIALCILIVALAGYAFAKVQPQYYTAFGTIALEGQTFASPELQGAIRNESLPDPMPLVRTEEQALASRQLVRSVIAKLGIENLPEFNPSLRPPTIIQEVRDALRTAAQSVLGSTPSSEVPDGPSQVVEGEVMRSLLITQDNRSLVIGVGFISHNPELAASFVNTLIADYVAARSQRRLTTNQNANAAMLQRVDDVRADLNKLEQKIRDLRTKGQVVELRAGSVGQQQLEELATAASRASVERAQLEAQWQRANALSRQGSSGDLNSVLNSPTIASLRQQESQASQRLADLTSRYGLNYPAVRSAQANLEASRNQVARETQRIVSSLAAQLSVARAHEADTQRQLSEARMSGVKGENAQAELADLQQEVTARRSLYESLLRGAQQTVAQSTNAAMTLDVRVLSNAVPPVFPSGPNTKLAASMGGGAGLFVGLIVAFMRVRNADVFSTAEDVTAATGLPVIAMIPRRGSKTPVVSSVRLDPDGEEAEALRLLRVRLRFGGHSSVLFASVDDDRGVADIAAAFAYVAASDGERVILVEGNLHNPELAGLLEVAKADILPALEGEEDWRDSLLSDRSVQLDFLLTRDQVPAPYTLLTGPRFQNLLVDLVSTYNLVVLNAPSAENSDALALSFRTNATVMVIDAAKAKQTQVRVAASRLSSAVRSLLVATMVVRH